MRTSSNRSSRPSRTKDKSLWTKQLADAIAAGVQTGQYPGGLARLQALAEKLAANKDDVDTAAFVTYRALQAEYNRGDAGPSADYLKIQAAWLEKLEKFVGDYPRAPTSAEALLQTGQAPKNLPAKMPRPKPGIKRS